MPKHRLTPAEKAILSRRRPIKERLTAAFNGKNKLAYWQVAEAVFPQEEYPRSWRRPTQGGPPGCYMALTKALNRYGYIIDESSTAQRTVRRPREG